MGIPQFINWLVQRCPKCLDAAAEAPADTPPEDPNPRLPVFDCLYLDLNGAVHSACHNPDDPLPARGAEEEMLFRTIAAIDEVVSLVRPRRLLFIAIDGVAPEAKWREQRQRRFRKAAELASQQQPGVRRRRAPWDPNSISPATPFMEKLRQALRWYCFDRANQDPLLSRLSIVLSDSSVPGEGEHKIVHQMRQMRLQPGYDANTSHCIYGRDADLIALALGTHEHRVGGGTIARQLPPDASRFDLVSVATVREYLAADLDHLSGKLTALGGFRFERCVRDFVLLAMLVGSDVAPAVPSTGIIDGGLETLFEHYRIHIDELGGYLISEEGDLALEPFARLMEHAAQREERVLARQLRAPPRGTDPVRFGAPGWRQRYDEHCLEHRPADAADAYVHALRWRTRYFFTGEAAWEGAYAFRYAPLPSQLAAAARRAPAQAQRSACCSGPPPGPWVALLSVLPVQSAGLLPAPLAGLMTDASSPVRSAYPEVWEEDPHARRGLCHGTALLPPAPPVQQLRELIAGRERQLSHAERERGRMRCPLLFAHSEETALGAAAAAAEGLLPPLKPADASGAKRKRDDPDAGPPPKPAAAAAAAAGGTAARRSMFCWAKEGAGAALLQVDADAAYLSGVCGSLAPAGEAAPIGGTHAPRVSGFDVEPVVGNKVACAALLPVPFRPPLCGQLSDFRAPAPHLTAKDRLSGQSTVYAV
eukprot:TRINITY_DN5414_c0_g2_i1.p1 TRINITY_DN5414_c0_g2~~TRINITY_DN5414_c0_g2_i1.p1  ORF type:complete len:730 (+),score=213.47 TRINITY_DN5414_c0_g2_i1:75-2192(+)